MTRAIHTMLLALALWPALACAQDAPTSASPPDWEQLTPAERDALIAPLREKWNSNPEQRARMVERAERWKHMPREQRDHARKGMQRWEKMSPKQRQEARALFHVIHRLDPERRKAFLAEWRKMTPQQREEHEALNVPIAQLLAILRKRPLDPAQHLRLMSLLATQRIICNGLAQLRFIEV